MREPNQSLRSKAGPVIDALRKTQAVKAVLCFGSYAMGTSDAQSDIDLYAFCDPEVPLAAARRETLGTIEGVGRLEVGHTDVGWDDQWRPTGDRLELAGILFDIGFNTLSWLRTVVQKVKKGALSIPELRFRPYTVLGLLDNSAVLYDPDGILERTVSELYPFPLVLKRALFTQSLPIARGSLEDLQNYIKRGIGNTAFHFHLERILDSMGTMLFALNERYDPATKRVEDVYGGLEVVPRDFLARYTRVLQTPLTPRGREEIVALLESLLQELESLTEREQEGEQLHQGRPG